MLRLSYLRCHGNRPLSQLGTPPGTRITPQILLRKQKLDAGSAESVLREAGQQLYQWADLESGNISSLRIRERVTEPYIVRGGFHILANIPPAPRIYWHPLFLERLRRFLAVNA